MKGEIVDGTRSSALDLTENIVEEIWRELDDELTVEIFWEALELTGFYILLRAIYHVLLAVEYVSLGVRISPLDLIEQKLVQNESNLLEDGKSRLWQIFNKYHVSGKGIKVCKQLRTESKKDTGLYGNFVIESDSTLTRSLVPFMTETLTSSYCC